MLVVVYQIIQLMEDSYPAPRPCLKVKLTSATTNSDKKVQYIVLYTIQCHV